MRHRQLDCTRKKSAENNGINIKQEVDIRAVFRLGKEDLEKTTPCLISVELVQIFSQQ